MRDVVVGAATEGVHHRIAKSFPEGLELELFVRRAEVEVGDFHGLECQVIYIFSFFNDGGNKKDYLSLASFFQASVTFTIRPEVAKWSPLVVPHSMSRL
jgi:hypothetical protein